jgi:hypothetical protein
MSMDKKKFFGKHKEGGKQNGEVKELGSNIYVSDVNVATDKFVKTTKAIADYVDRELGKPMCDLVNGIVPISAKKDGPEARKWDRDYSHYLHQCELYRLNKGKVFVITLGQCTLAVKNRLKSLGTDYAQLQSNNDVLGLLTAIRNIALANANIQNPYWGAAQALKRLATVTQQNDESLPAFYKRWTNARDVAELQWGPMYPTKLPRQWNRKQMKLKAWSVSSWKTILQKCGINFKQVSIWHRSICPNTERSSMNVSISI